jgi:(+)-neomenthol dehydrogenase
MIKNKIALVTRGNRGIGLEICRQLIQENIFVILTARNELKGNEACKSFRESESKIIFHPLDMTDSKSIINIVEFVDL